MGKQTFLQLKKSFLSQRYEYIYFDTPEYLADAVFKKQNIASLKIKGEFVKEGSEYVVIRCSIAKRDENKFIKAMEELQKSMVLCNHKDYVEFCITAISSLT